MAHITKVDQLLALWVYYTHHEILPCSLQSCNFLYTLHRQAAGRTLVAIPTVRQTVKHIFPNFLYLSRIKIIYSHIFGILICHAWSSELLYRLLGPSIRRPNIARSMSSAGTFKASQRLFRVSSSKCPCSLLIFYSTMCIVSFFVAAKAHCSSIGWMLAWMCLINSFAELWHAHTQDEMNYLDFLQLNSLLAKCVKCLVAQILTTGLRIPGQGRTKSATFLPLIGKTPACSPE